MNFNIELSDEQLEQRNKTIALLKKNEVILMFLEKYHLDESFVENNSGLLLEWLNAIKICKDCKGLSYCAQKIHGKVMRLYMDERGFVDECFVSCQYEKKKEAALEHRKKFRFSHMSTNDYLIDLNDASFLQAMKESEYQACYNQVVSSIALNQGVYLYGTPGTGKSYLLKGVCNYYAKNGKSVSFVQVPLRFSDILVLDDIGAESITQWTRDEILLPVLDERMNKKMKTYFSSNYSMEELEQQYRLANKPNSAMASLRILERIRALSNPVGLFGKSRR